MHEAKTHLSRLVDEVEQGQPIIIAKAGKPKAKLVPFNEAAVKPKRRIGFMKGQYVAPADIKLPFAKEIEAMFYGTE